MFLLDRCYTKQVTQAVNWQDYAKGHFYRPTRRNCTLHRLSSHGNIRGSTMILWSSLTLSLNTFHKYWLPLQHCRHRYNLWLQLCSFTDNSIGLGNSTTHPKTYIKITYIVTIGGLIINWERYRLTWRYDKQAVNGSILANVYLRYIVKLLHIMDRYSFRGSQGRSWPTRTTYRASLTPPPRLQQGQGYTVAPQDITPLQCDTYDSTVLHETARYDTIHYALSVGLNVTQLNSLLMYTLYSLNLIFYCLET